MEQSRREEASICAACSCADMAPRRLSMVRRLASRRSPESYGVFIVEAGPSRVESLWLVRQLRRRSGPGQGVPSQVDAARIHRCSSARFVWVELAHDAGGVGSRRCGWTARGVGRFRRSSVARLGGRRFALARGEQDQRVVAAVWAEGSRDASGLGAEPPAASSATVHQGSRRRPTPCALNRIPEAPAGHQFDGVPALEVVRAQDDHDERVTLREDPAGQGAVVGAGRVACGCR